MSAPFPAENGASSPAERRAGKEARDEHSNPHTKGEDGLFIQPCANGNPYPVLKPGSEPSAPFTPGPWHVDPMRSDTVTQALGPPVARTYAPRFHGSRAGGRNVTAAANARLIAAAPDLYAELQRMVEHFGSWASDHSMDATTETWGALHCARAALTKADPSR